MELLSLILVIIKLGRLLLNCILVLRNFFQIAVNLLFRIFEFCIQCSDLAISLSTLLNDFVALASELGDFLACCLQLLFCILQIAFQFSS